MGKWYNDSLHGPDGDGEYVRLSIGGDYDENRVYMSVMECDGLYFTNGMGNWEKTQNHYVFHVSYYPVFGDDNEDILVYIVDEQLYLFDTIQPWGFFKQDKD